jgi:DinB superfamily
MSEVEESLAPRRALALLREAPDKVELLLRRCAEKEASRPGDCKVTIRSVVGRLGTLDRHHYLESVRRIAVEGPHPALPGLEPPDDAGDADLADCELPELVTRFRHVRAQATDFLEGLSVEIWSREGVDPGLGPITLSRVVAHWVTHDAAALVSLSALSAGLHSS